MATIYLDHNVIADIAGIPGAGDAMELREQVTALQALNHRFVLSAWNMYELARSSDKQHIGQCCSFVESLASLWVSATRHVHVQEVDRFLQPVFDKIGPVRNRTVTPFKQTVVQMWATFGADAPQQESFTTSVAALRANPEYLLGVHRAAVATPAAILTGRHAWRNGLERAPALQAVIEQDYLQHLLPNGASPEQLQYLVSERRKHLAVSPALALEDALARLRTRESFKPEPGDGPDLQHAIVPLGYCDYFVTNDRQLARHGATVVRELGLPCQVRRSVRDIGGS